MKKLSAILVSFLFLLPSIGLHIDLKHCCGGVETIGIAHQAALAVSECCDMQKTLLLYTSDAADEADRIQLGGQLLVEEYNLVHDITSNPSP